MLLNAFSFTASKSGIHFDECEFIIMLWVSGLSYQSSFYTFISSGFAFETYGERT